MPESEGLNAPHKPTMTGCLAKGIERQPKAPSCPELDEARNEAVLYRILAQSVT